MGPVIGDNSEQISACPSVSPQEHAKEHNEVSSQSPLAFISLSSRGNIVKSQANVLMDMSLAISLLKWIIFP